MVLSPIDMFTAKNVSTIFRETRSHWAMINCRPLREYKMLNFRFDFRGEIDGK